MDNDMIVIDISMDISPDMPVYKGYKEKKPEFKVLGNYENGDSYNSSICLNMHTGTHLDAPLHMIEGGDNIESFTVDKFLSDCQVLDLTETKIEDRITLQDLKSFDIKAGYFILLKTKNSFQERVEDFIFLAEDAAEYLIEKKIKGVGIDSLGIERAQAGHPTHKKLLANKNFILEGLRLNHVSAGDYTLLLAPLKIKGVEAAPCRALLFDYEK